MSNKNRENFNITECPYYLISRATLVATSALKRGFIAKGIGEIKPSYLGVLFSLWEKDGLNGTEIGKMVCLEPSSMTGLLDRMERDGLIQRRDDPDDRRAQIISLTEKAKSAGGTVLLVITETLDAVFADIPDAELKVLKKVLNRVLINAAEEG